MISTIREAKNDYYEACDSVLQIGHLLGRNRVQRDFTLTALKCHFDDKQHKTR